MIKEKRILLYSHGGSGNHGCEAIVRSTLSLFTGNTFILSSRRPKEDIRYLDGLQLEIIDELNNPQMSFLEYIIAKIKYILFIDRLSFEKHTYSQLLKQARNCDFALSIGGDNYCYGVPGYLYIINQLLDELSIPRVLWGASITPDAIDERMISDLMGFRHIFARESFTEKALMRRGIKNVSLLPDPAFSLKSIIPTLPHQFQRGNTVGINISPMIIAQEMSDGIVENNYYELIKYILHNTNMSIALIPHVIWEDNDDRIIISRLYNRINNKDRVCIISDMNCEMIKGVVSQCRFVVAARTHISIAAYSSFIPSIVVGYSIKADGIAFDLFGSTRNYVVPVQTIHSDLSLSESFKWLQKREYEVKQQLLTKVSSYQFSLDSINSFDNYFTSVK